MDAQLRSSNVLLSRLPEREFERLAPALEPISGRPSRGHRSTGRVHRVRPLPVDGRGGGQCALADGAQPAVATIGHEAWSGSRCSWVTSGRRIS